MISTPTNQVPVVGGHMTLQNEAQLQQQYQNLMSQQPLPPATNGYRTLGAVSSISTQPAVNRSQGMAALNNTERIRVSSAAVATASSSGG